MVGTVLLPGAIGIAVLRYRLYDVDVVISRTILYGGLAVVVTATYVAVVCGLGTLLGQRAGLNPFLAILAIGVGAALLDPVRAARVEPVCARARAATRMAYFRPYPVARQKPLRISLRSGRPAAAYRFRSFPASSYRSLTAIARLPLRCDSFVR